MLSDKTFYSHENVLFLGCQILFSNAIEHLKFSSSANVAEELNVKFYLTLINLNIYLWLVATVSDRETLEVFFVYLLHLVL